MSEAKRMVVATEGPEGAQRNCVIMPGALYVADDMIPVTWNNDHTKLLGHARNMERDGNEVSMEIVLDDHFYLDLDDDIVANVYLQPFEATQHPILHKAIKDITSGRIRAISLEDKILPKPVLDINTVDLDPRQEG